MVDDLLQKTSRTFGIAIPLLPEPVRREVTIAYLLFRIADTFEDGALWPPPRRLEALSRFKRALEASSSEDLEPEVAGWLAEPPCDHAGYLELLSQTPRVLAELQALPPEAGRRIRGHLVRTVEEMSSYVGRMSTGGELRLLDLPDLRRYCYGVAGIVGEMLTDLFLLSCPPLAAFGADMLRQGRLFGEGLQLVNILKDSLADAQEGRRFLAESLDRKGVLALAQGDLEAGADYVLSLQAGEAPRGLLAFVAFPLLLAWATLARIQADGPGSKISRKEVMLLLDHVRAHFADGAPRLSPAGLRELCADGG